MVELSLPENSKIVEGKTFGKERKSTINIRANNLLGDIKESMVDSYGTESLNFRLRNPGRIFSLGFKYRF